MSQSEERVFLERSGIRISSKIAKIHSTSYPIDNISSVSMVIIPPKYKTMFVWSFVIIISAMLIMISAGSAVTQVVVGMISVGIIAAIFLTQKTKHILRISSAGGEKDGLISEDQSEIESVHDAIMQAITNASN